MNHKAIHQIADGSSFGEAEPGRHYGRGVRHVLRRVLGRVARALGALVMCVVAVALAGGAYEAIAARGDANTYRPPGRLVDIGGFRLHIHCSGEGSPTVILDAGLGASSLDWSLIQPEVGATGRVCAYDRAGMGWSDPSPRMRTPDNIAKELHALLVNAKIPGPYVLVAHSLAGKYAQMFVHHYKDEVAGIVLVDARAAYVDAFTTPAEERAFIAAIENQGHLYAVARRFGVVRLFGGDLAGTASLSHGARTLMALIGTQDRAIATTTAEARARAANDADLGTFPMRDALPLVVLASDQSMAMVPHWAEAQRQLADQSSDGRLVVASGSSHAIHWDRPRLVVDEIVGVVAHARSRTLD